MICNGFVTSINRDFTEYVSVSYTHLDVYKRQVKDLVAGMTGDEPSKEIKYIAENLPYRDFVTVGLLVNKLNLKIKKTLRFFSVFLELVNHI